MDPNGHAEQSDRMQRRIRLRSRRLDPRVESIRSILDLFNGSSVCNSVRSSARCRTPVRNGYDPSITRPTQRLPSRGAAGPRIQDACGRHSDRADLLSAPRRSPFDLEIPRRARLLYPRDPPPDGSTRYVLAPSQFDCSPHRRGHPKTSRIVEKALIARSESPFAAVREPVRLGRCMLQRLGGLHQGGRRQPPIPRFPSPINPFVTA